MKTQYLIVLLFFISTEAAEISITPSDAKLTKAAGSAMLLSCSVSELETEEGAVQIHWIDNNGKEILETSGRRFVEDEGDNTILLYVTSIEDGDAGKLTCRATVNGQHLEQAVQLDIFQDIKILTNETQNPIIDKDALIWCEVSGNPTPRVFWRKDGKRLISSRYKIDRVKGLTIEHVTEGDNGVYTCQAEVRSLGRMLSRKINVVVHVPPRVTLLNSAVESLETEKVVLQCSATGFPKPTFTFTKGDSDEVLESSAGMIIDEEAGTLEIPIVQQDDSGAYLCTATNMAGHDAATILLKVLVPPKITEFLPVTATSEYEASLTCRLEGIPLPDVVFGKQDGPVDLAVEQPDRFSVTEEHEGVMTLQIEKVEIQDAGIYTCSAKNSAGEDVMETELVVRYIPVISTESAEVEFNWLNHQVNFTCEADAMPNPTFQWVKYEEDLSNNDTYHIFETDTTNVLQVTVNENEQAWIYGEYHCIASNELGEVSRTFTMNRANAPDMPMSVMLVTVNPTHVTLSVTPPEYDGGLPILGYLVDYKKVTEDEEEDSSQPSSLHEDELRKEAEPSESLKSSDDAADSEVDNEPREKLESEEHDAVSEEEHEGEQTYEGNEGINHEMNDDPAAHDASHSHWSEVLENEDTTITINDLDPETKYVFRVRAKNEVGAGLPYIFHAKTTSLNVPSMVELSSNGECQESSSYKAAWNIPYDGGQPISTYVVKYRLMKDGQNVTQVNPKIFGWLEKETKETEISLSGLRPEASYQLQVHARNGLGLSPVHDEFLFKTCKDPFAVKQNKQAGYGAAKPDLQASTEQGSKKGLIIGLIVGLLILIAVVLDLICCRTKHCGVIYACSRCFRSDSDKEKNQPQGKKMLAPPSGTHEMDEEMYLTPDKKV